MKRLKLAALGAVFLLGACDTIKLYSDLPKDKNVLFWTQDQRDNGFRALEKLATVRNIAAGGPVHAFGLGTPIKLDMDIDAYMKSQRNAGLVIVQDNKIRTGRTTASTSSTSTPS